MLIIKELVQIKLKTVLTVLGIILALLILTSLICLKLAYTDENTDKYSTIPDITAAQNIALNAVLGNESDISEDQLNAMIAYLIQQANDKGLWNKDNKLLAAYIDINTGKPSRCYFQVDHKDRKLGFSADVEFGFDKTNSQITMTFSNAKVGKLTIPKKVLIYELKKTNLEIAAKYISFDDLLVTLPSHFSFEIPKIGSEVEIDIENIKVYEDQIHIETNPILSDALDNFKDTLGDKILDFAGDYLPDNVGDYLENFRNK